MRRLSIIISIVGIFVLLIILNFQSPLIVSSKEQLEDMTENQKVIVSGQVIKESYYENTKILTLNNEIQIICNSCPTYLNKNISIVGILDKYDNRNQIIALKITSKN